MRQGSDTFLKCSLNSTPLSRQSLLQSTTVTTTVWNTEFERWNNEGFLLKAQKKQWRKSSPWQHKRQQGQRCPYCSHLQGVWRRPERCHPHWLARPVLPDDLYVREHPQNGVRGWSLFIISYFWIAIDFFLFWKILPIGIFVWFGVVFFIFLETSKSEWHHQFYISFVFFSRRFCWSVTRRVCDSF